MGGMNWGGGRETAFCPEIDDFVQLRWSGTRPEPVRTEPRGGGGQKELYRFKDCPTLQPVIERVDDLQDVLRCERLELTCWGSSH